VLAALLESLEEGAADYFEGYVNQGRFGVKECLVDPSVERPSFRVSCRMAPGDQTAWIQIFFANTVVPFNIVST